ncbi:cysteine hydrolase family protein [Aeromonas dhakensis]|uniref:Isochorismatase-like domain-containing protein n=1 Tax=Aeromonas dhakensis TaxID=196024 RepID=K1JCQ5_9GAMM|nr:cysteine hydrolase family protein [Aeromonas dhakensis]EKB25642.1 hypothetical protein HMPREF1171_04407 [Aeromonas dhakensis]
MTGVLVIDVQRALFEPEPKPFESELVVERINAITAWARARGYPVFFIQHEQAEGAMAFGSEGWSLHSNLETATTDVMVRKTTPDSFHRTELESALCERGLSHLIVCGYASEFCVDTTIRRAAALGFPIQLVSDAHTTHDKSHATARQIREHHNKTLSNVTSFGVRICTIETQALIQSLPSV